MARLVGGAGGDVAEALVELRHRLEAEEELGHLHRLLLLRLGRLLGQLLGFRLLALLALGLLLLLLLELDAERLGVVVVELLNLLRAAALLALADVGVLLVDDGEEALELLLERVDVGERGELLAELVGLLLGGGDEAVGLVPAAPSLRSAAVRSTWW